MQFGTTLLPPHGSVDTSQFFNTTPGGVYAWHDYRIPPGGSVFAQEIGGKIIIDYLDIEALPVAVNPSNFQFQFDQTSGEITACFTGIDGTPYGAS